MVDFTGARANTLSHNAQAKRAVSPPFSSSKAFAPAGNNSAFKSERYTQLVNQAATEPDPAKLKPVYSELNDLFLLLCFMEATGLPNPASLYLLEIYPYLLEQFHQWHRRMGIAHSPIGSLPCC